MVEDFIDSGQRIEGDLLRQPNKTLALSSLYPANKHMFAQRWFNFNLVIGTTLKTNIGTT